jgi:DhnA family fructose-bisphosphate aldolase class Ia
MGYIGRKFRERRILFPQSNRGLIVPIDHGLTAGPMSGLQSVDDLEGWISTNNISAVLAHKGMIERLILRDMLHSSTGVIVHLNGMASIAADSDTKVMVSNIETALELGADAVSIQANFTPANFHHNIAMIGSVTDAAHAVGLPILVMLYDKIQSPSPGEKNKRLNHLLRVVADLGSEAVKLAFPESLEDMSDLLARHSRDIRIFFAGGQTVREDILFTTTRAALKQGASGMCIGRNVFQNSRPQQFLSRLAKCVKGQEELVT